MLALTVGSGQYARVSSWGAGSDEGRLGELQTLTDTTLTSLDLDVLLGELLERVRDIIAVDTSAVLLFERGTDGLVARAACGIEDEVRPVRPLHCRVRSTMDSRGRRRRSWAACGGRDGADPECAPRLCAARGVAGACA